jgi:hypothetical protein
LNFGVYIALLKCPQKSKSHQPRLRVVACLL